MSATGPCPEMKEKLSLFGQFVGDWDIVECRYLRPDGTWGVDRGELHWRWILDGRALQDVWMTIDEHGKKPVPDGTTVRFYDPKIDAWRVTWISPSQNAVKTLIGRPVGNEIVLEGKTDNGLVKWIFSEIKLDSFRWHSEQSQDNGKTWTLKEEMKIRRKMGKHVRSPLLPAPSVHESRRPKILVKQFSKLFLDPRGGIVLSRDAA